MRAGASPDGPSYIFGDAVATRAGTALTGTHDIKNVEVRLVAVDHEGEEDPSLPGFRGGASANGYSQFTARFDLAPEEIRKYRLQTCPYERAEIPGVPLKPNGAG